MAWIGAGGGGAVGGGRAAWKSFRAAVDLSAGGEEQPAGPEAIPGAEAMGRGALQDADVVRRGTRWLG